MGEILARRTLITQPVPRSRRHGIGTEDLGNSAGHVRVVPRFSLWRGWQTATCHIGAITGCYIYSPARGDGFVGSRVRAADVA